MVGERLQWGLWILFFHNVILSVTGLSTAGTPYETLEKKITLCSGTNCYDVGTLSVSVPKDPANEEPRVIQDTNILENEILPNNMLENEILPNNIPENEILPNNIKELIPSAQTTKTNVASVPKSITVLYSNKKVLNLFADSSIDTLVDFIIDLVTKEITKKGKSQIQIPDIHETFRKRIGPLKVKGTFDATKGWFRSLSSLYRTQAISVSKTGSILTVTVGVGLREMVLGYEKYKARFQHIGPKGHIKGEVDHNSVEVKLAVDFSGLQCKVTLAGLRFKTFSKLKIHLSGLGKLSWIFSKVVTWVTNKFKGEIIHSAEKELSETLTKVLGRIHCYGSEKNLSYGNSYATNIFNTV